MPTRPPRRLAPMWVRELSRHELHGLTGKLLRDFRTKGLSSAQDWLLDRCINELEWRSYADGPAYCCVCQMCSSAGPGDVIEAFVDDLGDDEPFPR